MMGKANKVHFTAVFVLMSFAFREGSLITYNTQEGCNATLVCNQPGNVTWVYTATSKKIEDLVRVDGPVPLPTSMVPVITILHTSRHLDVWKKNDVEFFLTSRKKFGLIFWDNDVLGPRFQTLTHAFFSTLSIVDVSKNDAGNITCMAEGHNQTTDVKVCHNDIQQCLSTINAGDNCTSSYIRENCKQSCKLCPEPDCPETVLPTLPPTTANPQTTNNGHQPTTESDSTVSSSTRNVEKGEDDGNSGVSLAAGFHIVFVLASGVFSVIISMFPNV